MRTALFLSRQWLSDCFRQFVLGDSVRFVWFTVSVIEIDNTIHFFFSLKITDWQQLLMAYHFTSVNSLCVIIQCVVKINIFSFNIIINQTVIEKQRRRNNFLYWFKTFHWWFAFILFALKWSLWRKYNIYCHLVVGDTPYMHGEEKEIYVLFFS